MTGGMPEGTEIERKFLVDRLPDGLDAYSSREINQGYVAVTDDIEVRLRRYGDLMFVTIKSGGDGTGRGGARDRRAQVPVPVAADERPADREAALRDPGG
jgi:CYTH domain-containing protein